MILTQDGYTTGDDPAGVPLIGYDNQISAITATSSATGFPVANLLNSATHLKWEATSAAAQTISITNASEVNYLAIARQNFAASGAQISLLAGANADALDGTLQILTHFDGTNGSAEYYDVSGNDVPIKGSATLTNTQVKFGTTSLNLSGAVNINMTGSPYFVFGTGAFTIDFWIRINATGVYYTFLDTTESLGGIKIAKNAANVLIFRTSSVDRITGTTALTTGQWYHVLVARSGTSTKMFLNGTQEGSTYSDSNNYSSSASAILGSNVGSTEFTNGFMDEFRLLLGKAAYTANFTAPTTAYQDGMRALFGNYSALFHFDGTDASTTITDSSGNDHVFTAHGNAQLDTADKEFGTASLLLDGTGDYIAGDGSADFAFGSGDFTIDFWFNRNTIGTQQTLYDARPFALDGLYPRLYFKSDNKLYYAVNGVDRISGTTAIGGGAWRHCALTRSSGSTRLFFNGGQEGSTYADTNVYLNAETGPIIGINASTLNTEGYDGHLDEIRLIKGTALWTQNFGTPSRAATSQAVLGRFISVDDDLPLIFRFASTSDFMQLKISSGGSEAAQMAVMYAGQLLVLERGVKVDTQHLDINHARRSNVLQGMSENGNFLGRVVLSESKESEAEFAWFTPSWYRTNFEPFVQSAIENPFFWAWNPDDYPEETAFAWLAEDVRPETDPATRRMAAIISMRAIA